MSSRILPLVWCCIFCGISSLVLPLLRKWETLRDNLPMRKPVFNVPKRERSLVESSVQRADFLSLFLPIWMVGPCEVFVTIVLKAGRCPSWRAVLGVDQIQPCMLVIWALPLAELVSSKTVLPWKYRHLPA